MGRASSGRVARGTCLELHHVEAEARLQAIVAGHGSVTPEYSLQWSSLEPAPGVYRWRPMDGIVRFAQANGLDLHGHALLWEQGTPGWGTPDWVKARLRADPDWNLIRQRFETVLTRYRDAIPLWTVVNEAVEPAHGADGLRANAFLRAFGPDYISAAFETAREFAPEARLMLNEYGLEYDNPTDAARRDATLRLLDRLKSRDVPIHAFGLQGHLDLGKGRIASNALTRFLRQVAGLGLEIHVTELDVLESDLTAPIEERDARVATETQRFLDTVLDQPAVASVSTWGVSDRFSWLRGDFAAISAEVPEAGRSRINRGLPFDVAATPKPMARVLADALGAGRA